MDGRNSCGRRISLLNDEANQHHNLHYNNQHQHHHHLHHQSSRQDSLSPSLRSRSSSYISSPPTPPLVRSNSSDSTTGMQTPSPVTPDFVGYERTMGSPLFTQAHLFPPQKELGSAYPPLTHISGPLPYHPAPGPQAAYYHHSACAQQQGPDSNALSACANPRSKKNSYPCPMAKQYGCNDYFTTSGHAARHAKKHTGKKDAFCPECNKAFTRKDNMEQHRRTHQSGRNAAKSSDDRTKKSSKQPSKRPKPSPLQSDTPSASVSSLDVLLIDPALSPSQASYPVAQVPSMDPYGGDYSQRSPYPDLASFSLQQNYSAMGSCLRLDALAIAASSEKRKYETA